MPTRVDKPLDQIGRRLREEWGDLADSPLPERLRLLLERLAQNEKPVAHRPDPLERPH